MTTTDTTETTSTGPAATSDTATMSVEEVMDAAIEAAVGELAPVVGTRAACAAVGRARATHYRHHRVGPPPTPKPRVAPRPQPRALSAQERVEVRAVLNSERFVDAAPASVYATLLDEGRYLCSESSMYRILREHGEVRERRRQATHPPKVKPELVATGPNQCWSWDITKLLGPKKWTYYHLYVIIDIYSRYVPGWLIAERESAALAERLLAETITKQHVERDQLTIHADRGTSMASKPVAMLLADLGVTKSHSRPHCSNDNPFSEAQFKTLKYRPDFPDRFGSIQDARSFSQIFFGWYNDDHRHSGIGLHTPADVHYGRAGAVRAARAKVLTDAYVAHPERFVRKHPEPPALPGAVWINKPQPTNLTNP
jgi:putative transposase